MSNLLMKMMKRMSFLRIVFQCSLFLKIFLFLPAAHAAITITNISNLDFGKLATGASNRVFDLDIDGTLSGSGSTDLICCQHIGEILIEDDTPNSKIQITATNLTSSTNFNLEKIYGGYDSTNKSTDLTAGNGIRVKRSKASATLYIGGRIRTTTTTTTVTAEVLYYDLNVVYY